MLNRVVTTLLLLLSSGLQADITGWIVSTEGKPVAGAVVSAQSPESLDATRSRIAEGVAPKLLASVTTGEDGAYRLELEKGAAVIVSAVAPGHMPASIELDRSAEWIVALQPAPTRRGRVTASGKPVEGARVTVRGAAELSAITGSDGSYEIVDPKGWAGSLVVVHPDYAWKQHEAVRGEELSLDVTLDRGITLQGRVVRGETPVAGAKIRVDGRIAGTSGDDGSFAIASAPRDYRRVVAEAQGSIAEASAKEAALTLSLRPAAAVEGTVRSSEGGPLAETIVTLSRRRGRETDTLSTLSDARGGFRFEAVAPDNWWLSANTAGHSFEGQTVTAVSGQVSRIALTGSRTAIIAGRVMSERGEAVSAAAIRAVATSQGDPRSFRRMVMRSQEIGWSAPNGRFVLHGVPTDRVELVARSSSYAEGRSAAFDAVAGPANSPVTITLPAGIALEGIVRDTRGRPVSGVEVRATESAPAEMGMMRMVQRMRASTEPGVETDASGRFSAIVREGTYELQLSKSGFAPKSVRGIRVEPGAEPVVIEMQPGLTLRGKVIHNGAGVAGVDVNLAGAGAGASRTETAADGSFRIDDLAPGEVILFAVKPDEFIQEIKPISLPFDEELLIDLGSGGTIRGRAVDKASGRPLTDFSLGISADRGGPMMRMVLSPSLVPFRNDDGRFVLENVKAGAVEIVAQAPGYLERRIGGLRLEEGGSLDDVVVELEKGARLTGRVTGPDGKPLEGATVAPQSGETGPIRVSRGPGEATTDGNGEYVIAAVQRGELTVEFSKGGYVATRRTTEIRGDDVRLDARLERGRAVRGQVVDQSGAPVAESAIVATSALQGSPFRATARSDSSGAFEFDGLAPGRYQFTASHARYARAELSDVDISSGAPVRLVLGRGATLRGQVSGLSSAELTSAIVIATGGGNRATAPVDPQGRFLMEGAPTGSVSVSASVQSMGAGRSSPAKIVEVSAGGEAYVDIDFHGGSSVRGRVTSDSRPSVGAMILFEPKVPSLETRGSARTDSRGQYEIQGLRDGDYHVTVMDPETFGLYRTEYRVSGGSSFDIDVAGSALRGRVVDSDGNEPIADATITIESSERTSGFRGVSGAVTDPSGVFRVEGLAPGTYRVRIEKARYGAEARTVTVGSGALPELEVKLRRSDGLALRVVDARDQRQLDYRVTLLDGAGGTVWQGSPSADATGRARIDVAAGSYRMVVSSRGYATSLTQATAPSAQPLTIGMTPGGTIEIESKRDDRLSAKLLTASGLEYPRSFWSLSGDFVLAPGLNRIENVAPGSYAVRVLDEQGRILRTIPVTVAEGGVARAELN